VFKEVTRIDFVEEHDAILELIDVHLLHCGADELLVAVLSCLPNFVVLGASIVDGLSLLHSYYYCIFGNLVIPETKTFGDGKCNTGVVGHVGVLHLHNPYNMLKSIHPVIVDGLQDVKELFLQGKIVVIIWLVTDGRLGVQSILEELCNICW
jgi:hypothetical protein